MKTKDIIYIIIILLVMIFFFTREPKVIYKEPIKKYEIVKIDSIIFHYDTITYKIKEKIKYEKEHINDINVDVDVSMDSLQKLFTGFETKDY